MDAVGCGGCCSLWWLLFAMVVVEFDFGCGKEDLARPNSTDTELELRLQQCSHAEIQELLARCAINVPDRESVEVP